jgi:manganese efflux pump family protein
MTASLILLALALAADAFAVAIGQGAVTQANVWRRAFTIAVAFGLAQAIAPLAGWWLGFAFAQAADQYDHWIAFGLLAFVGGKLMYEGLRADPPGTASDPGKERPAGAWALLALSVATSIDAAAAGVALPAIGAPLVVSLAAIGSITFGLSFLGVWIGRAGSRAIGPNAEIIGGLVLIVIGAKILFDHHAFG